MALKAQWSEYEYPFPFPVLMDESINLLIKYC